MRRDCRLPVELVMRTWASYYFSLSSCIPSVRRVSQSQPSDILLQAPAWSVCRDPPSPSQHRPVARAKSASGSPMVTFSERSVTYYYCSGGSRGCGQLRSAMLSQCEVYTQREDCYCDTNLWVSLSVTSLSIASCLVSTRKNSFSWGKSGSSWSRWSYSSARGR